MDGRRSDQGQRGLSQGFFGLIALIALCFAANPVLACPDIGKKIDLKNSPFFFKEIDINSRGISIKNPSGNETYYSCEEEKKSFSQYTYVPGSPREEAHFSTRKKLLSPVASTSFEVVPGTSVNFAKEFPPVSDADAEIHQQAVVSGFWIRAVGSDKSIKVSCAPAERKHFVFVEFFNGNTRVGAIPATQIKGARSAMVPGNAAKAQIDFMTKSETKIAIVGCPTGQSAARPVRMLPPSDPAPAGTQQKTTVSF